MSNKERLYLVLVLLFIVTFAIPVAQTAGLMPAVIVSGSMVGGLLGWCFTSLRHPTDPRKILPIYLLTIFMLYVHIGEEYLAGFGPRLGAAIGSGWSQSEFIVQFGFYLPTFWILGALGLYYRHPLGNFIAWFIFFGMFMGEPTHLLVFPNLEGGRYHYFPGMWTALLPMVMGVWGIAVIWQEQRSLRQRALTPQTGRGVVESFREAEVSQ